MIPLREYMMQNNIKIKYKISHHLRYVYASCLMILIFLSDNDAFSDDRNIVWYDGRNLAVEGKGWTDTEAFYDRLPLKAKNMVRTPVWNLSRNSAGLNIRFMTDADSIHIEWTLSGKELALVHMPATGVSGIDLYGKDEKNGWYFIINGQPKNVTNKITIKLPDKIQEYMLYLPLYNGVKDLKIGIDKNEFITKIPADDQRKQIVFYGTSITQGACASRPGMAFTSIISRRLNTAVINLGFSGNGRMEPELAELLSELDPSIYILDCLWNMTGEMVAQRVESFIKILRKSRPHTPILLVEDSNDGNMSTKKGDILRNIFDKLKVGVDKNLYFLANTGMLGEDGDGTVDRVHPNDLGMIRHAEIYTPLLKRILLNMTEK